MGYPFQPPMSEESLEARSDPFANDWVIVETRLVSPFEDQPNTFTD